MQRFLMQFFKYLKITTEVYSKFSDFNFIFRLLLYSLSFQALTHCFACLSKNNVTRVNSNTEAE